MQEPKDGDFVAYIEALQRESAVRLAQQHVVVHEPDGAARYASVVFQDNKPVSSPTRGERSIEGALRADTSGRLAKALVATVAGALFLLHWLGKGGPLSFIAGVALLAYGAPRLAHGFRALNAPATSKARIEQVFGRSATSSGETKP